MNGRKIKIIDGSSNPKLVKAICNHPNLNGTYVDVLVDSFADSETRIEINENMRGCDVFVVQPTSDPVNEHVIQLYLILDALKRSNCWRVTAVVPYYGYARQDKKLKPRVPISARAVADLIQLGGINRLLTMDLHSNQIQGYFNCAVDNLFSSSIFLNHMKDNLTEDTVMVSPDVGGIERVVHYSKKLGVGTAMIHKSRSNPNEIERMVLLGSVRDCRVIIADDMIDTAGTLCKAATVLKDAGAKEIVAYASHGLFSGDAYRKIIESSFDKIYVTDSIDQDLNFTDKIEVLSCADLFANAIVNIHNETSVSCLFE